MLADANTLAACGGSDAAADHVSRLCEFDNPYWQNLPSGLGLWGP